MPHFHNYKDMKETAMLLFFEMIVISIKLEDEVRREVVLKWKKIS